MKRKRKPVNIKQLHKIKKSYILCIRYESGLDIYRFAIDTRGYHIIYLDIKILPSRLNEAASFIYDKIENHPKDYTVKDLENDLINYLGDNAMYVTEDFGFRIEHDDSKFYKLYIDTDVSKNVLLKVRIPVNVLDNVLRRLAEIRSAIIHYKPTDPNSVYSPYTVDMLDYQIAEYIRDINLSAEYLGENDE